MSLPTSGQVYLTGTVHLRHGCRASGNVNVIFYQASIECRPCTTRCETVQGLFRDYVAEEMSPLPDGLYNVSSKVTCSPPRRPCQFLHYLLRLSHFAPTCLCWTLRVIMTLSSYLDRLSTYVEDNLRQIRTYLRFFLQIGTYDTTDPDQHSVQISGTGFITSSDINSLSFYLHISQSVAAGNASHDIVVECCLNDIAHFLTVQNLHQHHAMIHFAGEFENCRRIIFTNNSWTTCASIRLL